MELNELRERAKLPNALHGCTSDPCGSVVCQTARDRDTLLSRIEQAEQAVQRLREVAESSDDKHLTMAILEALDGGTRLLADDALGGDQHG